MKILPYKYTPYSIIGLGRNIYERVFYEMPVFFRAPPAPSFMLILCICCFRNSLAQYFERRSDLFFAFVCQTNWGKMYTSWPKIHI